MMVLEAAAWPQKLESSEGAVSAATLIVMKAPVTRDDCEVPIILSPVPAFMDWVTCADVPER